MTTSNDAYESLLQFMYRAPIGLVQTSLDGDIEMINPKSAQLLMPFSQDGSLDNLYTLLQDSAPTLRQLAADADPASGIICESLRISLHPEAAPSPSSPILSLSMLRLVDDLLLAVFVDVTLEVQHEQQVLSRKLSEAERVDKLTGLPTRVAALELLQTALDRPATDTRYGCALLYISCNRFKLINDALGYNIGNQLLSLIAGRLGSTLRSRRRDGEVMDGLPLTARIGGDEFAVMLDDLLVPENVTGVAQRILDRLGRPYAIGPHKIYCSVSMGIVVQNRDSGNASDLLQDASLAMENAKRAGDSRYAIFEPGMRASARQRRSVEDDLQLALAKNQLFVVYQPVVGLQGEQYIDGAIDPCAGMEALVRWQHPVRGVVSPVEFIGIAEECGMIDAIGEFVLDTACRQFMTWQALLGPRAPRKLAVNLSREQLSHPGLAGIVDGILRSSGMPASCLQLEVTESLAAQSGSVLTRLHELKALGLTLALDDFGTGYSSLSSLHQIPVDTVKIDRSFVRYADTSLHHRILIDATIRVAHSLGMDTVAEGIETFAQAEIVRQLGCDKGQGYLYSKPVVAADFASWLTDTTVASKS